MFEWDASKAMQNRAKHGVDFAEACEIFSGPVFTARDTRHDYGENRLISIGSVGTDDGEIATASDVSAATVDVVLVVVHTKRHDKTRLISARKANLNERKRYYGQLKKALKGD